MATVLKLSQIVSARVIGYLDDANVICGKFVKWQLAIILSQCIL
jgi:hypothetical protein